MREWKVNVVNAPNLYVLIAAESALEAEVLARRDGYSTFGMTVLWSGEDDGDEFEGLTPRELRNIIRTLQEDLKRAVTDRRKLVVVMDAIYNAAWSGMNETGPQAEAFHIVAYHRFSNICDEAAKIKAQVEGT